MNENSVANTTITSRRSPRRTSKKRASRWTVSPMFVQNEPLKVRPPPLSRTTGAPEKPVRGGGGVALGQSA